MSTTITPADPRTRSTDLAQLLDAMQANEPGAADALAEAIYDDLRAMARRHLVKDFGPGMAGATIQPTVLANDTLMKLIRQRQRFDNAGHFFAIASRVMMRVLLDYHRERQALKRGGGQTRVPLDSNHPDDRRPADGTAGLESFDQALAQLAERDARKADVVRYRVLWGLGNEQIAEAIGVSLATVERDWAFARAWLARELAEEAEG